MALHRGLFVDIALVSELPLPRHLLTYRDVIHSNLTAAFNVPVACGFWYVWFLLTRQNVCRIVAESHVCQWQNFLYSTPLKRGCTVGIAKRMQKLCVRCCP